MSVNKSTIETYMKAFTRSDHAQVLACLTDDVEWFIPGMFHVSGKQAFDEHIESDCFLGSPTITTTRTTEENDVVVAEGTVRTEKKEGGFLNLHFCDVFEMEQGKIRKLTSYLMEIK